MDPQVANAIAQLEPGARVKLQLSDGREVSGVLREKTPSSLRLADSDDVEVAQVESVLLDFRGLEGPE